MLDPREIAAGGFGGIHMRRATEDRIDHAVTGAAVLAAHLLLVWIAIQVRVGDAERDALVAPRWIAHDIGPTTVEVQWNKFEVHHEHATSEWLIAVDRERTVWNARASRAPWQ
jgi:hypothetical protein